MKFQSSYRKPIYSALVFFGTLGVLSAGYAGFITLQSSDADPGKTLTSTMMQAVIGNLADLDTRVSTMSGVVSSLQASAGGTWNIGASSSVNYSAGNVGIGTSTPATTLDVNGSISSQGPAGEASTTSVSAPTGWKTVITGFTTNSAVTVGGGFTPSTGVFKPTVAGRYLFTFYGYSGVSSNWGGAITKNNVTWVSGGGVSMAWNGIVANASYVANLNGTTDYVNFGIANYSGTAVSLSMVIVTWTKLP